MSFFNRIILVGRLTRDPETRYTTSGTSVSNFTLAVDRVPRSNSASDENSKNVDFIRIVAFGRLAELANLHLKKGRLTLVEGELRINKWQSSDGITRISPEVWARDIRFMEPKSSAGISREVSSSTSDSTSEAGGEETSGDVETESMFDSDISGMDESDQPPF